MTEIAWNHQPTEGPRTHQATRLRPERQERFRQWMRVFQAWVLWLITNNHGRKKKVRLMGSTVLRWKNMGKRWFLKTTCYPHWDVLGPSNKRNLDPKVPNACTTMPWLISSTNIGVYPLDNQPWSYKFAKIQVAIPWNIRRSVLFFPGLQRVCSSSLDIYMTTSNGKNRETWILLTRQKEEQIN